MAVIGTSLGQTEIPDEVVNGALAAGSHVRAAPRTPNTSRVGATGRGLHRCAAADCRPYRPDATLGLDNRGRPGRMIQFATG